MDENKEALRSMLNNLINDKSEEATLDLHNYLSVKMQQVAGLKQTETVEQQTAD